MVLAISEVRGQALGAPDASGGIRRRPHRWRAAHRGREGPGNRAAAAPAPPAVTASGTTPAPVPVGETDPDGPGREARALGQGFVLLLMIRVEALELGAERPGLMEQLARGGAAGDLQRLAGGAQPVVERLDRGVVPRGAERRHGQGGPQPGIAVVADAGPTADAAPDSRGIGARPAYAVRDSGPAHRVKFSVPTSSQAAVTRPRPGALVRHASDSAHAPS